MTLSDFIKVGILPLARIQQDRNRIEYFPHSRSNSQYTTMYGPDKDFSQAVGVSFYRMGRLVNPIYHPSLIRVPRLMQKEQSSQEKRSGRVRLGIREHGKERDSKWGTLHQSSMPAPL